MLSLNRDALSVVANQLSAQNIGCLRLVSSEVCNGLEFSTKFATISHRTNYSDEMCYPMVHELSRYATELTKSFHGKDATDVQAFVDGKNAELDTDLEKILSDEKNYNDEFDERLKNLKVTIEKVEQIGNEMLRSEYLTAYRRQMTEMSSQKKVFDTQAEFAKRLIYAKYELLSLEHLALLNKLDPDSSRSELRYEKNLMQNFCSRVGSEVKECGTKNFDRAVDAAKVALNNRRYLLPFTSSPDVLSTYLHTLENNLVTEMQAKYLVAPPFWAADCFNGIVSWFKRV